MSNYILNRFLRILSFLLLILLLYGCNSREQYKLPPTPQIPTADIQTCDLVFRLGRSIESSIIASNGKYSHIGIIIRSDSTLQVAHIEPSREGDEMIKYETLEEFFHEQKAVAGSIMRVEGLDSTKQEKIEKYLLKCKGVSFDHDYMLSDSSKMYCTELVHRAYTVAGIDLTNGIRHNLPLAAEAVILPSDIYRNPSILEIWSY